MGKGQQHRGPVEGKAVKVQFEIHVEREPIIQDGKKRFRTIEIQEPLRSLSI